MTLNIRDATPADVPQILQFAKDLATYEREPDAVTATEADIHEGLFGPQPLVAALRLLPALVAACQVLCCSLLVVLIIQSTGIIPSSCAFSASGYRAKIQ